MPEAHQEHPPVPRLVVRVGVTGHRKGPELASAELRSVVRQTLQDIKTIAENLLERSKGFYAGNKPVLRVISPLAEGADRLVAEEALELDYELQAPLPFPQSEYENDFGRGGSGGTIPQFRALLQKATAVLELDGSRASEAEAYEAVGRLMLRQCDVLIAVWDGTPERGTGGTGQIVREALSIEVPTIRIDAGLRQKRSLLDPAPLRKEGRDIGPGEEEPAKLLELLYHRLEQLLLPPAGKEAEAARRFHSETKPRKWEVAAEPPELLRQEGDRSLRSAFEWADNLANRYARAYRLSSKWTYLLGAFAVLFAYLGSLQEQKPTAQTVLLSLEITTLVVIGIVTLLGRRRYWHERWLDNRHLAESLRMMRLLALIGRVTSSFQVPAHLGIGDPRKTWFHWYLRALVREAGLTRSRLEGRFLSAFRDLLQQGLAGQVHYHEKTAQKSHRRHELLHIAAQSSFFVAALACILHFTRLHHFSSLVFLMNLGAIVLPAFGGALGAILHHSEMERIARRSHALEARLRQLNKELDSFGETVSSQDLARIAETFSDISLAELADWRFLLLDRPLTLPA